MTAVVADVIAVDLAGNPRPQDAAWDRGAYELTPKTQTPPH